MRYHVNENAQSQAQISRRFSMEFFIVFSTIPHITLHTFVYVLLRIFIRTLILNLTDTMIRLCVCQFLTTSAGLCLNLYS